MVTKTDLKPHDSRIEKYFDFILDLQTKEQSVQVRKLIEAMSQRQRNHFAMFLDDPLACKFHHVHIDNIKQILFNL